MDDNQKQLNDLKPTVESQLLAIEARIQKNSDVLRILQDVLLDLRKAKPSDRSEEDRRYAIVITDFEKLLAYFWVNIAYARDNLENK